MNNITDNIEYSLQQYAVVQAQLLNEETTRREMYSNQQQYTTTNNTTQSNNIIPVIRMAPPQLHQPTMKEDNRTVIPSAVIHHSSPKEVLIDSNNQKTPIRVPRPPNAYLLFNKEMRKILKNQDPTMKVAEISKEVGHRWKHIPKEQKDLYIAEANKLKEEQRALHPNSMYFRRSRAELVKAGHFVNTTNKKRTLDQQQQEEARRKKKVKREKKAKNSTIPKHPLSAYMWYLTETRPETMKNFPGSNVGQISKLCADRWNGMSEESRSPYISKAQHDKERYAREMQIYALQNDHQLGRGTRQKYRSHITVPTTTTSTSTEIIDYHHTHASHSHASHSQQPNNMLYYNTTSNYQLSAPTSPTSILRTNPLTLNPNALLSHNEHTFHHHH